MMCILFCGGNVHIRTVEGIKSFGISDVAVVYLSSHLVNERLDTLGMDG